MTSSKCAIVVGASSGIGAELVRQLAAAGWKVAAVARRMDRLQALAAECGPNVIAVQHDVHEIDAVPGLFVGITGRLGGLDLLIYASGIMPTVGPEEFTTKKDLAIVDVNVRGAIAWLNEGAARFGNAGAGSLVAIGSVAGDRGRFGQPVYNASKAFLHTYMEALRNRLARKGVHVVTIKPGPVYTEMTAGLDLKKAMSAGDAARAILSKIDKTGEFYLVPLHRLIFFVIRSIPSWIFRRLKI